ncbi:MAG: glycosyltransferase family 2 protein [Deltaproteobacteria bacterium]|nr:glycosyltransferase family 2 protein [Deltaproteobacteria bacterium]
MRSALRNVESAPPALSVVVPVYNEAGNAGALCQEIGSVVQALAPEFEIIFVNDGSRDATLAELRALAAAEPRLRIVDLDGNFGEAAALSAGFHAARGNYVVTLDGDGQNDPHDIPQLLETLHARGVRVVSGWRQRRQESTLLRVLPSRIANALISAVTRLPVHDNGCGLKVYERALLAGIQLPKGIHRFLPAILGVRPHQVAEVAVNDRRRQHGESHYGISRTLIVARDVLAIRFMIANPSLFAPIFAGLTVLAGAAVLAALASGAVLAAMIALLTDAGAAMVWWNLHRFNRAQRDGVYRVRCEYRGTGCDRPAAGEGQTGQPRDRAAAGA